MLPLSRSRLFRLVGSEHPPAAGVRPTAIAGAAGFEILANQRVLKKGGPLFEPLLPIETSPLARGKVPSWNLIFDRYSD